MLELEGYPALMTVAQVAEETEMSEYTIRKMVRCGTLPHRRSGRIILIPKSVLQETFAPTTGAAPAQAGDAR